MVDKPYAAEPFIAEVASLIGDPARANMLAVLKDEVALTATELAHVAGVTPQTASAHLSKLTEARLVAVEREGRHRYYRLTGAEVAQALEALEVLAVAGPPRYRPPGPRDDALRFARSCYDHLAGRLGVAVTWALVDSGYLRVRDKNFGAVFSVWDVLFGTYVAPSHEDYELGIEDDVPVVRGLIGV